MDVMAPETIWVENRCYRLCESQSPPSENNNKSTSGDAHEESLEREILDVAEGASEDKNNRIEKTSSVNDDAAPMEKLRIREELPSMDEVESTDEWQTEEKILLANDDVALEKYNEKNYISPTNDREAGDERPRNEEIPLFTSGAASIAEFKSKEETPSINVAFDEQRKIIDYVQKRENCEISAMNTVSDENLKIDEIPSIKAGCGENSQNYEIPSTNVVFGENSQNDEIPLKNVGAGENRQNGEIPSINVVSSENRQTVEIPLKDVVSGENPQNVEIPLENVVSGENPQNVEIPLKNVVSGENPQNVEISSINVVSAENRRSVEIPLKNVDSGENPQNVEIPSTENTSGEMPEKEEIPLTENISVEIAENDEIPSTKNASGEMRSVAQITPIDNRTSSEKRKNIEETSSMNNDLSSNKHRNENETPSMKSDVASMEKHRNENEAPSLKSDVSSTVEHRNEAETPLPNGDSVSNEKSSEEDTRTDIVVVCNGKGRYSHTFYIPKVFMPRLMGNRGTSLIKLQYDTATTIDIPRAKANGDTVIFGSTAETVRASRRRLDSLLDDFKRVNLQDIGKKGQFSHFISVPIVDETITASYETFKRFVLNDSAGGSSCLREGFFKKSEKLHLSLGILLLLRHNVRRAAVKALEECNERIVIPIIQKHGAIRMRVQGLCLGNAEHPTSDRVLCAKVTSENNALEELAEKIAQFYIDIGLMHEPDEKLKLQVTLMEAPEVANKQQYCEPEETFCRNEILMRYENYYFGEIFLKSIRLSERGKYDVSGYFGTRAKIHMMD